MEATGSASGKGRCCSCFDFRCDHAVGAGNCRVPALCRLLAEVIESECRSGRGGVEVSTNRTASDVCRWHLSAAVSGKVNSNIFAFGAVIESHFHCEPVLCQLHVVVSAKPTGYWSNVCFVSLEENVSRKPILPVAAAENGSLTRFAAVPFLEEIERLIASRFLPANVAAASWISICFSNLTG